MSDKKDNVTPLHPGMGEWVEGINEHWGTPMKIPRNPAGHRDYMLGLLAQMRHLMRIYSRFSHPHDPYRLDAGTFVAYLRRHMYDVNRFYEEAFGVPRRALEFDDQPEHEKKEWERLDKRRPVGVEIEFALEAMIDEALALEGLTRADIGWDEE